MNNYFIEGDENSSSSEGGLVLNVSSNVTPPVLEEINGRMRKISTIYRPILEEQDRDKTMRSKDLNGQDMLSMLNEGRREQMEQDQGKQPTGPLFIADFYGSDDEFSTNRTVRSPTIVSRPSLKTKISAERSTIDASTSTNVSPVNQEAPITVTSKISFIDDRTSEMPTGPSSALCNGSRAFSTSALDVTAPPLTVDEIADSWAFFAGITGVISALASTPPALSSSRLFDRQYSAVDSSVCSQPHSSFDVLAPSISTPHLERGAMMMNAGVAPRGYPYHHNRPNFYH
uniref:Uncharacterized protein n=1 Tax=Romanomermis culicivorax TaxID=13658 RepID=A0A915L6H8_ROMCU